MTRPIAVFFWNKIDQPGHDCCRLFKLANGWRLTGTAVFLDSNKPCRLEYDVHTDTTWKTKSAKVSGFIGRKAVNISITSGGLAGWKINGVPKNSVKGCIDVDLGFTPATNLIALRRLALKVGQQADAPAAYLQFPEMRLIKLPQRYHRISRSEYDYESPSVGYAGTLRVLPNGAVTRYPGLFELVTSG